MNAQINEIKDRAIALSGQAQAVANAAVAALKTTGDVVVAEVTKLAAAEQGIVTGLVSVATSTVEKAKAAGVKGVTANPTALFIPEGRDAVVGAYGDTVKNLLSAKDAIVAVAAQSYNEVLSAAGVKAAPAKKAAPKKAAAKKKAA